MGHTIKLIGILALALAVFGISYQYNKKFLDWLRFQSLGTRDYIVERLGLMFIEVPPGKALAWLSGGAIGSGSVVFLALLPNWMPGLILGFLVAIIAWKSPKPIVDTMYTRRVDKFVLQMVDALALMSNGLKSGLSVVQALGLVTQEMPNPIQQEFTLILSQNKLGVPLEECFTNLAGRIKSDDVEMFVTSINILKETGGNLSETFDTIVNTIRERIKTQNKIAALTAQGLAQGMFVMAIPPIMGLYFYQSDPVFMAPMFNTAMGLALIGLVVILEALGFIFIKKIIKIDV